MEKSKKSKLILRRKLIIYGILSLALVLFISSKWETWFGKIVENTFDTPADTINRVTLSIGEDVQTQRNLAWRSDTVLRDNWILLSQQGTEDTVKINGVGAVIETMGGKSAFYRAELRNLTPNTKYFYQIKNNKYKTPWYSFTMGKDTDDFSFVYFGDVQDRQLNQADIIFKQVAKYQSNADFWAFGGDMIERPIEKYWNIWYKSLGQIPCSIPIIGCPGDHEYFKGIVRKLDKRWTHYFPMPHNGPEDYKGRCCYWNYKNAIIVTLDSDVFSNPLTNSEQLDWLKEVLNKTNAKWKIVILHHPVYSLLSTRLNIGPRYFFKPIFEEYGVDLVLQGHDHGYSRLDTKEGNDILKTPIYVISTCSNKRYTPTTFDNWDRMAAFRKMYQVIKVSEDSLNYKTYDTEKGLYDDITIYSKNKKITKNRVQTPELLKPSEKLKNKGGSDLKAYLEDVKKRERTIQ